MLRNKHPDSKKKEMQNSFLSKNFHASGSSSEEENDILYFLSCVFDLIFVSSASLVVSLVDSSTEFRCTELSTGWARNFGLRKRY